ncbi:MAG: hypothetical protein LBQ84_01515 [Flavobacteriaceae bacterium]|jgi:hypothetical protein|nr:hypothetical protein [Flavobacteriaceae bacterium]
MKNFLILSSLFILIGCKKETNMYKCKGIPDTNQAFSYMYFKTEKEGYLFGTLTNYEDLTEKELQDPNNIPRSSDEANIYKTTDGGKNWIKTGSTLNFSYHNIATNYNNDVYILRSDVREDFKFNIIQFSTSNGEVKNLINTRPISSIWNDNKKVFFTNNRSNINLYLLESGQIIDSVCIKDYALFGLSLKNKSYAIFSNKEKVYFGNINKTSVEIKLPIIPKNIVKQDENKILIAGNTITNENEISLVSYDVNTTQTEIINKFKTYSIIENLQSNDKAIIGFIGNIKGAFTEYDLLCSLDKGKTWQIQKLEEPNYVRPSCLIDNIVYIYSGGARIQKIVLD